MQKIKCTLSNAKTIKSGENDFSVTLTFNNLEDLSPVDIYSKSEMKSPEPIKLTNNYYNGLSNLSKEKLFNLVKVGNDVILNLLTPDGALQSDKDEIIFKDYYLTCIEESVTDGFYILSFEKENKDNIRLCVTKEIADKFNLLQKMDLSIRPFIRDKD